MPRLALIAGIALLLSGAAAIAQPAFDTPPPATDAQIARGLELVGANCGMCHAIGIDGDSPNMLAPRFRDLHNKYPVDQLEESLVEGIRTHGTMPEFTFEDEDAGAIIAYLKSIQTCQSAAVSAVLAP